MPYKLLTAFEALFQGVQYKHRVSNNGDRVASFLVDDLYALAQSPKLIKAVDAHSLVLNVANKAEGQQQRRGDGSFGTIVPGVAPVTNNSYTVALGAVANIKIGAEVKILAKAMIKQIDRVGTDLINQAAEFRRHGNNPICVGIVGVNHAQAYTGFEGDRAWPTDGKKYKHPIQEAQAAQQALVARGVPGHFDEFLFLHFIATNDGAFPFAWVNAGQTERAYGAALVRLSVLCEQRL